MIEWRDLPPAPDERLEVSIELSAEFTIPAEYFDLFADSPALRDLLAGVDRLAVARSDHQAVRALLDANGLERIELVVIDGEG